MKNRLFILWGVIAALAFGVACTQTEEPGHDVPQPEELFEVNVTNVTRSTVTFDVTPGQPGDYVCVIEERSVIEEYTQDKYIVSYILGEIASEAESKGKTFEEYMPTYVDNGPISDCTFTGLDINTEYFIVLFGVDAQKGYEASTALVTVPFSTLAVEEVECEFNVTTEVVKNNVTINVNPSNEELSWYMCLMTADSYNYYTKDENGPKMSELGFYEYYFQQDINAFKQEGYSDEAIINALIHSGAQSLEAKGLHQNSEYYILIAGIILDSEGIVICTDVQRTAFTTKEAALSDMTFKIEILEVGQMEVEFRVIPSNNKDTYCCLVQPWDGKSTADEVMHAIVDQWGAGWMDVMADDKGVIECVDAKAKKLSAADTDYYVIAFGYQGGITTGAYMETFHTKPGGSIEDVKFTVTANAVNSYGFNLNVEASDPTIYYVPGACVEDDYDEAEYLKMEQEAIDYYYEESLKFDPRISVAEVLDQYYFNGNRTVQVSGLLPDTDVMAYIYAIDYRTGKIVKTFTFDKVAHTDILGNVTPTIEVVGYFSGDDEAGTIFGDADVTKGMAITVVKYGNLEDARTLYTSMLKGDYTNVLSWPDNLVWRDVVEWKTCKLDSPYTFYLVEWNVAQTAFAYATDKDGKMGAIARVLTEPTAANKGNIEVLRDLVAKQDE